MNTKINFRYSWIYNQNLEKWTRNLKHTPKKRFTPREIENYIKAVEKLWEPKEKKILRELEKIAKLKWKEKEIICYIVGKCIPFSDPLTIPLYKNKNWFIDVLIHELIHQLFTQESNMERAERSWKFFFNKYNKESHNVKIHIPLHAIHSKIYHKFFNKKRLKRDIKIMENYRDYKRAWEIVGKEGYQKIIEDFTSRLK